jgi:hypothetical protein
VFEGVAQKLPVQAGALTAPDTALNFTVISEWNKAIYWRGLFGFGKQGIAWVVNGAARGRDVRTAEGGHQRETAPKNLTLEILSHGPIPSPGTIVFNYIYCGC